MSTHTTVPVQQGQASTYNHPCADLLGGIRREYLDIAVPLCRASIGGDMEAAKLILDQDHRDLVRYSINEKKETPLHVAAAGHSTKFVRYLVNMMSTVDLELQNGDGNTAFCIAAISGNVGMAKIMFEKNRALPIISGNGNMTPLYLAAFHGKHEMVTFLYDQSRSDRMMGNVWTKDHMDGVLLKCVQAGFFDVALRILKDNIELPQDKHAWDVLQKLIQGYSWAFSVRPWPIFSSITSFLPFFGLVTPALKERSATLLLRSLWKRIMEKPKDVIDDILRGPMIKEDNMEKYPYQILFIVAKLNNRKVLVELIREYPDLIWKRNDDGQTIFHIAVAYRHQDVYSLLYEIGFTKDLITPITDNQGNNILHLVGKNPEKNASVVDLVSAPFQIRSEYLWFEKVRDIIPPPCREVKNGAGQTPQELFMENHNDLSLRSVKWIHETIKQSMVVAALVWTVGFSIVFSVPGGFDERTGFPIFLQSKHFIGFIVIDALSFFSSTFSIGIFLSITVSRGQQNLESLFAKWMIGQQALLGSIIGIFGAFVSSILILYDDISKRTLPHILLSSAVCVVMCLYITMYFQIHKDEIITRFLPRYLFKPEKHMLYRKK